MKPKIILISIYVIFCFTAGWLTSHLYRHYYDHPFIDGDLIEVTEGNLKGCQGVTNGPWSKERVVNTVETWCNGELINLQMIEPYEMKHVHKFNDVNFKAYNEFHKDYDGEIMK